MNGNSLGAVLSPGGLAAAERSEGEQAARRIVIGLPDHLIDVITLHTSVIPFPYSLFVTSELFRALGYPLG